ncbi:CpsD/CapB family tyrosine-protein kinase [Paenibacillus arenilitoris]|uniref:non-specific protein-tyrosine kinase n=1 Tax=Paenibacillus arenilitoris TaxID=2772299 RepID=A0A927CUE8_9BACL|nr:CpsD/CapB family tyrosine-protein kinase [Paenibacillus arenilitoris]MBD2872051.1 CpsD/CapB family tyrosine-protein kinase [Paenibacillus arenilitoris]
MVRERKKAAKAFVGKSLLSNVNPYGPTAEQFRTIRNNIQYASKSKAIRSLLVTSPSEGEGKSTAAVNLAVCMAQRGDRVLVIDANFRNPMLHQIFGVQTSPGLSNVLGQQLEIREAIYNTEVEGLDILPSGQRFFNTTELLDSERMADVMDYASSHYDRVVLDCPPVLGTADTNALAGKCDGVILLLKSGKTQEGLAKEAKRSLLFAKANILGVILNKKSV